MARNSENIAGAISAVNNIVSTQTEALAQIKTTLARKAGGGTDISLGITSAAVGDIVKVKTVDASGKPTEWEAAELSPTMPLIFRELVPAGMAEYLRTTDASGKALNLKRWELWIRIPVVEGVITETKTFYINDGATYSGITIYYNDKSVPCYYYQLGDYTAQNFQEMFLDLNYAHETQLGRRNAVTAMDKCTKIRINTFSDTVTIPENTEVTLFGIE